MINICSDVRLYSVERNNSRRLNLNNEKYLERRSISRRDLSSFTPLHHTFHAVCGTFEDDGHGSSHGSTSLSDEAAGA